MTPIFSAAAAVLATLGTTWSGISRTLKDSSFYTLSKISFRTSSFIGSQSNMNPLKISSSFMKTQSKKSSYFWDMSRISSKKGCPLQLSEVSIEGRDALPNEALLEPGCRLGVLFVTRLVRNPGLVFGLVAQSLEGEHIIEVASSVISVGGYSKGVTSSII